MLTERLLKLHILLLGLLILWFLPLSHGWCRWLDKQVFLVLNHSIQLPSLWQSLWGYLNHYNENWLNLVVMVGINIWGILVLPAPERMRALKLVAFFWLFFQLVLSINHAIFTDLLHIDRLSPSLQFTPYVVLSKALNNPNIKDFSENCFPAGHALVLVYWLKFTALYAKQYVLYATIFVCWLLCLPRLFSGAHWLSDIIFTIVLAHIGFYCALSFLPNQWISKQ